MQDHAHEGGFGERDAGTAGASGSVEVKARDFAGGEACHRLGVGTQPRAGRSRPRPAQRGEGQGQQRTGRGVGRNGPPQVGYQLIDLPAGRLSVRISVGWHGRVRAELVLHGAQHLVHARGFVIDDGQDLRDRGHEAGPALGEDRDVPVLDRAGR